MGASAWAYFTPYEDDAETALQKLRARVFEQGEYLRRDWKPRDLRLEDILPPDPCLTPEDIEGFREALRAYHALEEPTTIERLLAWNPGD
jgi:hypothetical protein